MTASRGVGLAHAHGHGTVTGAHRRRLGLVLGITLAVMVLEVVGAMLAGSLALLADAGHMLTDALGVGMALVAATLAQHAPTARRTFGWQRLEILAAGVNAVLLLAICAYVLVVGIHRIVSPGDVATTTMLTIALIGLLANAVSLRLLTGGKEQSLNVRGAYLEVLGDLLGSAAVVVAAIVIAVTGWVQADAIASIVIGILVLPRAWVLLREALDVLLEATPRGVDLDEIRGHVLDVPGVVSVHDLHAWTITSGLPVLSAHVVVDESTLADGCGGTSVLDKLSECLGGHFDVEHCTFQLEPVGHRDHERSMHA